MQVITSYIISDLLLLRPLHITTVLPNKQIHPNKKPLRQICKPRKFGVSLYQLNTALVN
jgi:hypothetical protein